MSVKKEKQVTIVMPAGVDAGKKIKVDESTAANILESFGEYRPPKDAAQPGAKVAALEAELADRDKRIAELEADLEKATAPAGGTGNG